MNTSPNNMAAEILKNYKLSIPLDVKKIAEDQGLEIELMDLDPEVSGFLLYQEGEIHLGVNKDHHSNRQRFTIAHELGHFVMHKDQAISNYYTDKGVVFFRDSISAEGTDQNEKDANSFAAALLMPTKEVRARVKEKIKPTDEITIRKLANEFGVSQLAMTFRLTNLSLVESF